MHDIFDNRRYLIPFRTALLPQIFTDVLVVGSGAAGLTAAIEAAEHSDVILISKGELAASNTAWAQGGIAAVLDPADSTESHTQDTLTAGAGLCDEPTVRRVIESGPGAIRRLLDWGLRADKKNAQIDLAREGGHSARRILHCDGDATGRELERCLIERAANAQSIRLFDHCFALDLITPSEKPGAPCMGAITHHPRFGLQVIWARATILASGGAGMLWRETSNPPIATADGPAMAYRAGASLGDLAFMQFHPTTLYVAGAQRKLISEAVRGEGALLLDESHRRFMPGVHDLAELAPRDIVARAIHDTVARQGTPHVYLDARPVQNFADRFPGIAADLAQYEINPAADLIPVNPAAHYTIGGVWVDAEGRSDVPGLYAVGEASCTGLHGANRLASNSLLEAVVLGAAAGVASQEMRTDSANNPWNTAPRTGPANVISDIPISDHGELDLTDVRSSLRSTMWRNVAIERSGSKLEDVQDMFDFWARYTLDKIFDDPAGWETQNLLLAGALTTRSASWRTESRGCHARADFPEPSDEFRVHDLWRRTNPAPSTRPVFEHAPV